MNPNNPARIRRAPSVHLLSRNCARTSLAGMIHASATGYYRVVPTCMGFAARTYWVWNSRLGRAAWSRF
jgi:hypothetical protein